MILESTADREDRNDEMAGVRGRNIEASWVGRCGEAKDWKKNSIFFFMISIFTVHPDFIILDSFCP